MTTGYREHHAKACPCSRCMTTKPTAERIEGIRDWYGSHDGPLKSDVAFLLAQLDAANERADVAEGSRTRRSVEDIDYDYDELANAIDAMPEPDDPRDYEQISRAEKCKLVGEQMEVAEAALEYQRDAIQAFCDASNRDTARAEKAELAVEFVGVHLQAEKDRAQKAERALVDARECFACDEKLRGHVYCEADYDLATRQLTEAEQRAEKAERELADVTQSAARVLERCLAAETARDVYEPFAKAALKDAGVE